MPSEKQIAEAFDRVVADVPGYIAASLVDLDSGMTLGQRSVRADFDLTSASAFNSEMVKQKLRIIQALGLKSGLEDILITLSDQLHVIKMVSPTAFIYLCVDRVQSNLAIARNALVKHARSFV